MVIMVIELGPFGCRIDRGIAEDLDDLPEGYEVKRTETKDHTVIVYIEPIS